MFNTLSTKTKILIPMFLLTAILIFIGATVTVINYSNISSLKNLQEKIIFSAKVSTLIHSIQKERGLSCGFVSNKNGKLNEELLKQRLITDKIVRSLSTYLNKLSSEQFQESSLALLENLAMLPNIRERIDLHDLSYNKIIKYYSFINSKLLDIIVNISKKSHISLLTQNILAYTNLLYFKEYMGIERAYGVTIYSQHSIDRKNLIQFSDILSLEKRHEEMFFKYASPTIQQFYKKAIEEKSFLEIKKMQKDILYNSFSTITTTPKKWFNTITKNLNILDMTAKFLEKRTSQNILRELTKLNRIFTILTLLIFLSIFIFIFMLIAFFKLVREEQRLRIIMDKYIISSTTDLKGNIVDVSQAFCTISGYTRKELLGKSHPILKHPELSSEIIKNLWFKLQKGLPWRGKIQNKSKDGNVYWVYANVEPLFTVDAKIDSYIFICLDITESELLLLKIKDEENKNRFQAEKMKEQSRLVQMGEMLSMIAHQWRQPLSAIAAASGVLQLKASKDKLDTKTAIEIALRIKGFSQHLSNTIDDFRNFFKSNKSLTNTNFETILQSVLSIIESSLEQNKIELKISIEDIRSFQSYENELKQVILNLIKNAEDALCENKITKPFIKITITKTTCTIEDNAGGIPKDIISKIFDPYFSTKIQKNGTGLGLYMSKMIIEDHCSGELTVSNGLDGAKFKIILGMKND